MPFALGVCFFHSLGEIVEAVRFDISLELLSELFDELVELFICLRLLVSNILLGLENETGDEILVQTILGIVPDVESFGYFPHSVQSDVFGETAIELCDDLLEIDVLLVL